MTEDATESDLALDWRAGQEPLVAGLDFGAGQALSAEAWVDARTSRREGLQALVSQWSPPDVWPGFSAFDATDLHGLPTRGYFGAVCDGRYVYFVPEQHGEERKPTHGIVLRYDTHGPFDDRKSYAAYDAGRTGGIDTRGFYGAVFDGRYAYFVPRQIDMVHYHSRILRYDTHGAFDDDANWAVHDAGEAHSQQSAAFDGRYIYFCPGFTGDPNREDKYCGRVLRLDTQADFADPASSTSIDISEFLGPECACFDGAAFDGRYVYLVPLYTGIAVRFDTERDFRDPGAWQRFDARPLGYQLAVGAVFDGRYLYYCAYGHATIVRFDTRGDFTDPDSWESWDADHTEGLRTTGFDGGFFDGRFVYFQPFFRHIGPGQRDNLFHSHYLRYDPNKPFVDAASWQAYDASNTDSLHSVGYNGGAFDGRYFYAAPWQQGPKLERPGEFITHGIVLRCDTLGECGTFSLRYGDLGHNGGLNAGAPGPSFLVNTDSGALSVALHRSLAPGRHHMAGVYDGRSLALYVDGELAARREGTGRLVSRADTGLAAVPPVAIGRIDRGQGFFDGEVLRARVWRVARDAREIAAASAAR